MTITSVQTIARRANILIQVVDENLGTGTGGEASYDLDNYNVIPSSYTVSYANSTGTGTNSFTDLTEGSGNDYTLDRKSGRVLLTGTGVSAVNGKTLYATYDYLGQLDEDIITQYQTVAEERLRELTGRYWESTTVTEYIDGQQRSDYPQTDRPFQADRAVYDKFMTRWWPVNSVSSVYFLDPNATTFSEVISDDGGSYTDNTTEAGTADGTAFNVFAATPATNDAIYFGHPYKFLGLQTSLETVGVDGGSLAVTWEYYNGSSWASLSTTAGTTGSDLFTASGIVTWTMPSAWAKTTVNSGDTLYFVRARLSAGSYSTAPTLWEAFADKNNVLSRVISVRDVDYTRQGRITLLNQNVSGGINNVRITYTTGVQSTDHDYNLGVDLANLLASLMCTVAITGGSFDDETSFTLGSKSVTIGEVYVNVAEVNKQIKTEIEDLKGLLGVRFNVR